MKINQSTQFENMLAPLRVEGVNIVSCPDGVVITGVHFGIMFYKPAKNRVHLRAITTDQRIPPAEKDFPNLNEAIAFCAHIIALEQRGEFK